MQSYYLEGRKIKTGSAPQYELEFSTRSHDANASVLMEAAGTKAPTQNTGKMTKNIHIWLELDITDKYEIVNIGLQNTHNLEIN